MDNEAVPDMHAEQTKKPDYFIWGLLLASAGLLGFIFYDGLAFMVQQWERDEYSHGYMIPMVALYLIWQQQDKLPESITQGSWWGVALLAVGLSAFLMGELGSLYTIVQYAFLLSLYALMVAFAGWRGTIVLWAALAYLVFMIPLPNFLYNNLSSQLQLISSTIGVAVIRLFDISVYLEGNVIDLGTYQLQVVEACSGLRYLFPLMSFGFLIACLYKGPVWQKVVLFLSTIPITVIMNSIRIGIIGVTVEHWGIEMAEGFLHSFEGWVVFMSCLGVLVLEMWCFHRFSKSTDGLWNRLDLNGPERTVSLSEIQWVERGTRPFIAAVALLVFGAIATPMLESRQEPDLARSTFDQFPLYKEGWIGRERGIEEDVLQELQLTDYFMADYRKKQFPPLNFYVAYYASQRKGASIHSPASCLPGGGWRLSSMVEKNIDGIINSAGEPLTVNRALMRKGESAQIVYYWFEQRGRNITSEYMAKWYMFVDALTLNRTDGALLRVVVPVADTANIDEAERTADEFLADFYPLIPEYIPGFDAL